MLPVASPLAAPSARGTSTVAGANQRGTNTSAGDADQHRGHHAEQRDDERTAHQRGSCCCVGAPPTRSVDALKRTTAASRALTSCDW